MRSQPDYIKQLEALPPKLRDAWLYGRWDVYEGQFFEEFADRPEHYRDRRYSHVIAPFDIPPDWRIFRSFDWGYNRPFSCGWWAVDHDGTAYRILELYGCTGTPNEGVRFTPKAVFSEIHRIETEHSFSHRKAHYRNRRSRDMGRGNRREHRGDRARCGVHFIPGDHKRIPGWLQVHYRMAFDREGFAMMYVFSNCRAFIRTIPTLLYDTSKPEDLNTDGEDHVADEVRYFCMSRPISPRSAEPDDYKTNPLRMFLDIPRESLRKLPPPDPGGRIEIIGES